jgi:NAD(P)-dependent dehydrogenase (short-subunit alcohol dehydrogenase family)
MIAGRFQGRRIVVTGATQGIGKGIAELLASEGARLLLLDIEAAGGERTAAELRSDGGDVIFAACDVGSSTDVRAAVDVAQRTFGGIDALVNNAGIYPRSSTCEMPDELWDRVLRTNLTGAFYCAKYFIPLMSGRTGGSIISIASGRALQGAPNGAAYASTKAGLIGFTRSLALEFAGRGIRVNVIVPGIADTAQPRQELSEDQMMEIGKHIPLGRIAQPVDIARGVAFLLSEDASYITGHTLVINGGAIML